MWNSFISDPNDITNKCVGINESQNLQRKECQGFFSQFSILFSHLLNSSVISKMFKIIDGYLSEFLINSC